ncbi:hypothetical protein EON67_02270 [archaeon]|nr:MAG: hypothetical protein EON67_02270 [archaeon]
MQGYRPLVSSVEKTGADGKKSVETVVGDYTWMTYSQIAEKVTHFGSGVVHLGLVSPNMEGVRSFTPRARAHTRTLARSLDATLATT